MNTPAHLSRISSLMPIRLPLFPYQEKGVVKMCEFLISSPAHAVYCADDPGLGKTRMTIETCMELGFSRILVICPAVMRLTWKAEFQKWSFDKWKHITPVVSNKDIKSLSSAEVGIISYDLASKSPNYEELIAENWSCLVLDEAHYLKSTSSQRTKIILNKIWSNIPYRIALSGTPFLSSITDVFPVFDKMLPDTFGNYYQFANKFSNRVETLYGTEYRGVKNPKLLNKVITKYFFFRRKKEEVLKDLPGKIYQKIVLPETVSIAAYEEELKKFIARNPKLENLEKIPPHLAGLRRLQGILKVPHVVEYVKEYLRQEIPIVLFAYHRDVIEQYMEDLKEYEPVCIRGDTSSKNREYALTHFQSGKTPLFIGQIQASGIGITLTRASHCIFGELDWSPAAISQATDRLNRIGQKNVTNVHYFVVTRSIDETISRVVIEKARTFSKVLQ